MIIGEKRQFEFHSMGYNLHLEKKKQQKQKQNSCSLSTNFDPNIEVDSGYRCYFMTDFGPVISAKVLY